MARIQTHYDNLKVTRDAPPEVIRAAYKALSQKHHPDRHNGDKSASRIMAIINASYDVLSDPVRRRTHDVWIAQQEAIAERQPSAPKPRHASQPAPQPQPPPSDDESMRRYGITRDGDQYAYGTYRFGKLKNAVAHAKHVESLRQGA